VDSVQYLWQRAFFAVLTEVDSEKFVERLIVADDEVFERLLELEGTVGPAGNVWHWKIRCRASAS
jgi:hypothetical protein